MFRLYLGPFQDDKYLGDITVNETYICEECLSKTYVREIGIKNELAKPYYGCEVAECNKSEEHDGVKVYFVELPNMGNKMYFKKLEEYHGQQQG